MNNDKLINAIILYHNGKIELNKIREEDLLNDYELYAPISTKFRLVLFQWMN